MHHIMLSQAPQCLQHHHSTAAGGKTAAAKGGQQHLRLGLQRFDSVAANGVGSHTSKTITLSTGSLRPEPFALQPAHL